MVGGERVDVVGAEGGSGDEGEGVVERRGVVVGVEGERVVVNDGVEVDVVVTSEAGVGEVDFFVAVVFAVESEVGGGEVDGGGGVGVGVVGNRLGWEKGLIFER